MKIDARDLSRKDAIRSYKLLNPDDTAALGRTFSQALQKDWSAPSSDITRIGLYGTRDVGKTTFTKALFGGRPSPLALEHKENGAVLAGDIDVRAIRQSMFLTHQFGIVRHVDSGFGNKVLNSLKAYRDGYLENNGYGGVDIVEHPDGDPNPDTFDCVIWLERSMTPPPEMKRYRTAHVIATPEFAARPGFQKFIASMDQANSIVELGHEPV